MRKKDADSNTDFRTLAEIAGRVCGAVRGRRVCESGIDA